QRSGAVYQHLTCRILRSIVRVTKKSKYLYYNALSNKFQTEWNGILFYIVCVGGCDIDMRKFVWDNLFRKSVEKSIGVKIS
ncbi:hypothetical protein RhiirC2_724236, partial [Rhizophagus irregularis]